MEGEIVQAEGQAGISAQLAGLPSLTLDEGQLGDLELLLTGAFAPLRGYLTPAEVMSVSAYGTLPDGTPWPVPVTLDVPAGSIKPDAARLLLQDPEGTPLAVLDITGLAALDITDRLPLDSSTDVRPGYGQPDAAGPRLVRLSGPVAALRPPEHGPFRELRRLPAEVRAELADTPVLGYVTSAPLHSQQIGQLRHAASQLKARLLLLPRVAGPAEIVLRPDALVRAVRAAARSLPPGTLVIPVPLRRGPASPADDLALQARVAAAYGATQLLADAPAGPASDGMRPAPVIPVLSPGDWAYDPTAEVWRPLALIEAGTERTDLATGELDDLLDRGEEIPAWFTPPAVAAELRRARPPRNERGLVVFFTGLSGSGKSTLARALRDALSERGDRTVSLLDGDLVRALLSAGLTFSRADRDLNIARIGFVATEIARHGGIAICAPIAPYAQARRDVRRAVQEVGDFLLIYVATPAEVCEARDRKGLYAKARAGLIDHFTGVSDPYEEPGDADLVIDTSVLSRQEALAAVLQVLVSGGWIAPGEG
jgi:sulfate adenylyltransferase